LGAELDLARAPAEKGVSEHELLFGESASRLVLEVRAEKETEFLKLVKGLPVGKIGRVLEEPELDVRLGAKRLIKEDVMVLKGRWKRELI
jgi:phosphoribosylformylglycinamidine (FGAM) synthase-like enzyme